MRGFYSIKLFAMRYSKQALAELVERVRVNFEEPLWTQLLTFDDSSIDQDETNEGPETTANFDRCIKSFSALLNGFEPYPHEMDEFGAPYIHPRALVYKDRKEKLQLEKLLGLSDSARDQTACFKSFFECRPNGLVRVALFATCNSGALERRERKLSWSLWVGAIMQRKSGGKLVLLVLIRTSNY
jgi:hypothetical protein